MESATRKRRLAAIAIDVVLISLCSVMVAYEPLPDPVHFLGLAAGAAVLLANLYFLTVAGQTLGKRALGIRIVRKATGENGGFVVNVLRRGVLTCVPFVVLIMIHPLLGWIWVWADILFIFRLDRRCLHDHIAGTLVVQ